MESLRDMIKPFVSNVDDLTDQQVLELFKALKKEGKIVKHKSSVNEEEDKGEDDAKSKKTNKKDKKVKRDKKNKTHTTEDEEKKEAYEEKYHIIQPKEFELKRLKSSLSRFKDFDKDVFKNTEEFHGELGAYKYKVAELTGYREKLGEIVGENHFFIGEVNADNEPDGIGIMIHKSGVIQEGYWKNGLVALGPEKERGRIILANEKYIEFEREKTYSYYFGYIFKKEGITSKRHFIGSKDFEKIQKNENIKF